MTPPEEIPFEGAVLVRARAAHAEPLVDVLVRSLAHLAPWMPWATPENATVPVQAERLANVETNWVIGTDYDYLIVTPTGSHVGCETIAGGMSLMTRQGPGVLEIGYWLSAAHIGRGLASNAACALTTAGFGLKGIERTEIHCDGGNVRSAAVPLRLGYTLDRVVDREPVTPGDTGREMVWTMQKARWNAGVGS